MLPTPLEDLRKDKTSTPKVAVDSSNALKAATRFDTEAVRAAVEFSQAYESVADEAEASAGAVGV